MQATKDHGLDTILTEDKCCVFPQSPTLPGRAVGDGVGVWKTDCVLRKSFVKGKWSASLSLLGKCVLDHDGMSWHRYGSC